MVKAEQDKTPQLPRQSIDSDDMVSRPSSQGEPDTHQIRKAYTMAEMKHGYYLHDRWIGWGHPKGKRQ